MSAFYKKKEKSELGSFTASFAPMKYPGEVDALIQEIGNRAAPVRFGLSENNLNWLSKENNIIEHFGYTNFYKNVSSALYVSPRYWGDMLFL